MHIYLIKRDDDAPGFDLNLRRDLAQLVPDVTVTPVRIFPGERQEDVPRGATILMLVGPRWLRPASNAATYFDDPSDPLRRLLEAAIKDQIKIVPVLLQVSLSSWGALCRDLPASLRPLAAFNAFEIHPQSFATDLQGLMTRLRAPDRRVPWTEAGARTLIRVQTDGGGAINWWSNRNISLRVLVDDAEVGGLTAWDGRLDAAVQPGRHTVQICQGPLFKSETIIVDIGRGATVTLVCRRNILTGTVSLEQKG